MIDSVFGELISNNDDGWYGKKTLEFGGNMCTVDIWIHGEEKITQKQRNAF